MTGNNVRYIQSVIMVLLWGWMIRLMVMGVGRRLGNIEGTFNCGFEAMGNKVYFDMMKLLLPFCVFEFEVVVLVLAMTGQFFGVVLVIIGVMLVELAGNGFTV